MARHVAELNATEASVRIPELRTVGMTRRVLEIVDHPAFQRLRTVRQLGPTHLVYPGAVHSRFEHSLGVFDMARQYLTALLRHPESASVTEKDVTVCLLAGLLHDLGHYPFAHSLEAVHHEGLETPRHEDLTGRILLGEIDALRGDKPIGTIIREQFKIDPAEVVALVTKKPASHARPERRLVASVISSGVDADKADYLERDSIHMGVTYGRNYDRARFLDSLCPSVAGDALALTDKGRVSAEIFIFCRYTMFSEAYWHHTVRAVSAMIEHGVGDWRARTCPDVDELTSLLLSRSDDELLKMMVDESPHDSQAGRMLGTIVGGRRDFYRRVLTLNRSWEDPRRQNAYERIYHLDQDAALRLRAELCEELAAVLGVEVALDDLVIDTPPRDKDKTETVEIVHEQGGRREGVRLEQVSKVVQGIATDFVKVVKKIRVFVHPRVRAPIRERGLEAEVTERLLQRVLLFRPEASLQQRLF
jgi:HD superfamily phosphohydrolase